ncbi:MAG: polynucleotide 5'-hydroxyl-kinase [Thermodesulfovibrionaceae bacterium]
MIPEAQWDKALDKALKSKKIILLGEVDSGKSTFAKYLIKNIVPSTSVCFIDSDVGQSTIGIPTTIAIKVFDRPYDFNKEEVLIDFDKIYFFGATTPTLSLDDFIEQFYRAVKFSQSLESTVLVDTTGLVAGDVGKNLKLSKIKIFEPDLVIIFEKKDEMRHIISEIKSEIFIFKPSSNIKPRNLALRAEYRKKKFLKYFKNSESFMLEKRLLKTETKEDIEGRIIGLYNNEECLAVGIIEELGKDGILFSAPISDLKKINRIKVGYLNLKKEGVLN